MDKLIILLILFKVECFSLNIFNSRYIGVKLIARKNILVARSESLESKTDSETRVKGSTLKGLYRRPSRAIELGGGFYVPGFEGERIRILTAAVLSLFLFVNRIGLNYGISWNLAVSETVTVSMILLLVLQSIISIFESEDVKTSNSRNFYVLKTTPQFENNIKVKYVLQSSADLKYILVLQNDGISFELNSEDTQESIADKIDNTYGMIQGLFSSENEDTVVFNKNELKKIDSLNSIANKYNVNNLLIAREPLYSSEVSGQVSGHRIWLLGYNNEDKKNILDNASYLNRVIAAPIPTV